MRRYYWYLTAFLKKHGLVMIASIVAAIVIFSLIIPRVLSTIENKKRSYIGVVAQPTIYALPPKVLDDISSGLTKVEADGTVSPSVAERWVVEDDGRHYRFVIRQNLQWHDGTPVNPDDFEFNYKDVEVLTSPNDIIFKLPEPFVPFPQVVSRPQIRMVPERHMVFFERDVPMGVGAFQVTDYAEDENGKLSEIVLDSPSERRIYRFYQTEQRAITAYKLGEVDILPDLSATYDIGDWDTTSVNRELRTDRYAAIFFDNANPLFSKNVRQALSYALPKPTEDIRATSPINPQSWAYLEGGRGYDYDLDRAFERLFDQLPPQPLTFDLITTSTFEAEAEAAKLAWEEFGRSAVERCQSGDEIEDKEQCPNAAVSITVRVNNFPDLSSFDAAIIGQQIPPDPDQYHLWHSEQSTNFTHYKNTRIDALLERGRVTADANERQAIYQEFQQFFLEDAPAVFLRHLYSYQLQRT